MRVANALFPRAWASGVLPDPDLTEATLFAMARHTTRLDDFGPEDFLPALRALLPSLREEAHLHPLGRVIAHGSALKVLRERAWAARFFNNHPEILERPLPAPLVIVGSMRSGTTRLHRLLACDPGFAHLKLYEAMCPVPWPGSHPGRPDPRARYVARGLAFLNWINPAIAAVHPTGAYEPDEELGLLEASFWGAQIEAQRPVPSYARWCESADAGPAYAHMARLLRLTGWWRGDDAARPWLLKTPQHMANLPALRAALPGARVIFTDRDPVAVVASSASLAWNQMLVQTDTLDPAWVGAEWLHKTAWRVNAVRRDRAGLDAFDARFEEVDADPMAVVARIYAWLDRPLAPGTAAAMRAWLAREAARPRHAAHSYRLADFGLDAATVEARLGDQCA